MPSPVAHRAAEQSPSPTLSIITVCFNARDVLPATLASLRAQGAGPWEWVVVDGASRDGSVDWLREQSPDVLISEPDDGIYDAMNKAVGLATGEYLYFLNAGDAFADARVLSELAQVLQAAEAPDLLYGNALYVATDGRRHRQRYRHITPHNLVFGNLCHQAVFARRSLFERHGRFDVGYPITADLDWLVRVMRAGASYCWIDRDICLFAEGGLHAQNLQRLEAEKRRMQEAWAGPMGRRWGLLRYRLARRLRRLQGS